MKKLFLVLAAITLSLDVSAGQITTRNNDKSISSKCIKINENGSCTDWYIIEKYSDLTERVIGKVNLEVITNNLLNLKVKERTVTKFQYFPATNATWVCAFDEKCQGDDALAAEVLLGDLSLAIIFGAIPPVYDIASLPIRALVKGIQIKSANSLEKDVIQAISVLIDDSADNLVLSKRKYFRYRQALLGIPDQSLELFNKLIEGKLDGCKVITRDYAGIEYTLQVAGEERSLIFHHFETDRLELVLYNLVNEGKCKINN